MTAVERLTAIERGTCGGIEISRRIVLGQIYLIETDGERCAIGSPINIAPKKRVATALACCDTRHRLSIGSERGREVTRRTRSRAHCAWRHIRSSCRRSAGSASRLRKCIELFNSIAQRCIACRHAGDALNGEPVAARIGAAGEQHIEDRIDNEPAGERDQESETRCFKNAMRFADCFAAARRGIGEARISEQRCRDRDGDHEQVRYEFLNELG